MHDETSRLAASGKTLLWPLPICTLPQDWLWAGCVIFLYIFVFFFYFACLCPFFVFLSSYLPPSTRLVVSWVRIFCFVFCWCFFYFAYLFSFFLYFLSPYLPPSTRQAVSWVRIFLYFAFGVLILCLIVSFFLYFVSSYLPPATRLAVSWMDIVYLSCFHIFICTCSLSETQMGSFLAGIIGAILDAKKERFLLHPTFDLFLQVSTDYILQVST